MNELKNYNENMFDNIKHIDEAGKEYWLARELMPLLEYKEWRKFEGTMPEDLPTTNKSLEEIKKEKLIDLNLKK